jgi:hypothetical protein
MNKTAAAFFKFVSSLAYTSTLKMEAIYLPKFWLTFTELHGIMSQKTDFYLIFVRYKLKFRPVAMLVIFHKETTFQAHFFLMLTVPVRCTYLASMPH